MSSWTRSLTYSTLSAVHELDGLSSLHQPCLYYHFGMFPPIDTPSLA
jgi:hypothetical protein